MNGSKKTKSTANTEQQRESLLIRSVPPLRLFTDGHIHICFFKSALLRYKLHTTVVFKFKYTVWILTNVYNCATISTIKVRIFSSPLKNPMWHFVVDLHCSPWSLSTTEPVSKSSGIQQCTVFYVWLLSRSIKLLRLIHVVGYH